MSDDLERLRASPAPEVAMLARRACELALEIFPTAVVMVDEDNVGPPST